MSCTKCGKVGHWASQCTAPPEDWVAQGRTPAASGTQPQRQPQEQRATQKQPTGCFKCGKSGHWSRDCTAPKEDWVQRDGGGNAGRTDENDAPLPGADQPAKKGVKRKVARKPRPKVTIEDLKKDSGLKHLVDVFPAQFRTVFRGPGHEASDLRRLLDMYQQWHRLVAPALQYDAFIDGLEKMGQTHVLKMKLRGMRDSVMQAAAPQPAPEAQPARTAVDSAADAADDDGGRYEDDYGGGGDMDDDELVALQAEQWETAAPDDMFDDFMGDTAAAAPAAAANAATEEDDAEIEELLAAAEAMPLTQPEDAALGAAAPLANITASQAEMEELLAMAGAMDDSPPDAGVVALPRSLHLSSTQQEREDEELLALAAMSDDEVAAETGAASSGGAIAANDAETVGGSTAAQQPAGSAANGGPDAQVTKAQPSASPMAGSQDLSAADGTSAVAAEPPLAPQVDTQLLNCMDATDALLTAAHNSGLAGSSGAAMPTPASAYGGGSAVSAPAQAPAAEVAAVGSSVTGPATDIAEPLLQSGSLVPPDIDLAGVDDEELLQMALA